MIKQAALFCFLFSFFLTELSAQDTAFYLHGRVVDSLSGDPLRNVKVSLVETMRGTYTNKKGEFTLAVRKVRSVISFSAPGYLTTYTSTPLLPEASHSIRMKKLESKADPAPATSWEKVFRNGNWALLDFELQDNLILALARQEATAKFYLLILDKNGDEKNAIKLREPAVSFYRDYKKQLFVVCEEHAYPVNLNSFSVIEITRATGIKDLEKKIIPWVGEDSINLYHRLQSGNEYFINTELTVLVRQSSESYFAITKKENRKMLMKNIGYEKYNPPAGNWKKRTALSETRLPFANDNNVVYDDLPLRLLQSGNSISIFDMDERRAESYDSTGKLMMSANFRSDNDAYYSNRVLTDDNGRFYYCALKPEKNDGASAVTAISELNIKTGTHRQAMLLDAAAYSSLKISGGYLYYLKRENPKSDRFFLARTKLRE